MPPSRIQIATELQKPSHPAADPGPRLGLGYMVDGEDILPPGKSRGFGHGGYGGSYGHADPDNHLAIAFTNNLYSSRSAGNDIRTALYEALGIKK
jgi:CubicO group peptidase (beta-lactamase class C family)